MQAITTIGLDIAKSVFQIHGVDADGQVIIRRQLKRRYVLAFFEKLAPCLIGIEACASSHHWSRQLRALGHTVRLMPPSYVKSPTSNDKRTMPLTPRRYARRSAGRTCGLCRPRHLNSKAVWCSIARGTWFIRQQTSVINAIRAHCAEFGIVAPVGRQGVEELLNVIANAKDEQVPAIARACVVALGAQLHRIKQQILEFDRMITAWHRCCDTSRRLDEIPGVGPALATALVASVANPRAFRSGRDFSAWIGLVPKQNSSGGKPKLGSISKQGDRYLRGLFTAGALAVIRYAKIHGTRHRPWLTALYAELEPNVAN